eukprot:6181868-Pleurochrysis_carterae.AAC.1
MPCATRWRTGVNIPGVRAASSRVSAWCDLRSVVTCELERSGQVIGLTQGFSIRSEMLVTSTEVLASSA